MPATSPIVRPTIAADYEAWLPMWQAYCRFYAVDVSAEVTDCTWRRIVARDSPVGGLMAVEALTGAALGFANYLVHPHTWSERAACYLEDLFVCAERRGAGVGRALIDTLLGLGKDHGGSYLYWMTQEQNIVARRLYDRFTRRDDFVRYVVPIEG